MSAQRTLVLGALLATAGCGYFGPSGSQGSGATQAATEAPPPDYDLPGLPADPIRFEANLGQLEDGVRFGARAPGYRLSLTDTEAILTLANGSAGDVVRMSILGGEHAFDPDAWTPLAGLSHYLTDPDPAAWITNVPGHGHVRFPGIRPATDVLFHGATARQVELDFVLRPGASTEHLGLRFDGATPGEVDPEGRAHVQLAEGELVLEAPRAYQIGPNGQEPVVAAYTIAGTDVRIDVGLYDPDRVLVVDPVLVYQVSTSTIEADAANAVAVDDAGNAYLAGRERQLFPQGRDNVFASKRDSTGTLVWQTVLGHIGHDDASAIALPLDGSSQPILAGITTSCFFPGDPCSTNPQAPPELAAPNAFVLRLTSDGSGVVFGRSFGGSADDRARGVAVGADGAIHVVGRTTSTDFPNAGRLPLHDPNPYPDYSHNGGDDAFVVRYSSAGVLQQAGYLGGSGNDEASAVLVDGAGRPVVAGSTHSTNYPTRSTNSPTGFGGYTDRGDAVVSRFRADGRALDLSFHAQNGTGSSGSEEETVAGIAVDSQARIFVAGSRRLFLDLGELGGGFLSPDAFLRIYSTSDDGAVLAHESVLATIAAEEGVGVFAQRTNRADTTRYYFLSSVSSGGLPEVSPAGAYSGGRDLYLQVLTVGPNPPALRLATYLGTAADNHGGGLAVDRSFAALLAGRSVAGSSEDAYVARVQLVPAGDAYTALEDTTLFGQSLGATVLENDTELFIEGAHGSLDAVLESGPSHAAQFEFFEPGTFRYRASPNFAGTDSFTYRIVDGDSTSVPATVNITVQNVDDDPPIGVADGYTTDEDAPLVIAAPGVLANDVEFDGQTLSAELVRGPEPFGTISLSADGGFTFTPPPDAFTPPGTFVTFEYLARDAGGTPAAEPTLVSITVTSVNDPPVAVADYFATPMQVPLVLSASAVLANDFDVEGGDVAVVAVGDAANGTISLAGDTITFVPNAGFFGLTSFSYTLSDQASPPLSSTGVVTVLVSRPPGAQDDLFSLPASGILVVATSSGVLANDTDPDGESLAAQLLAAPAYGTLSLHPLGGFSYVADRDFDGSDTFTYRAIDAGGIPSSAATVTITGAARSGDESVMTDEDTPVAIDVVANDPGVIPNAPPETEVAYCYDGYDADCGGSDAPATAFVAGRLTRVADKPGAVAFAFDGAGRQVRETRSLVLPGETRTLITETAFDPNGNPVSKTHPTGVVVERVFDESDREVSVAVRSPGGVTTPLLEVGGGGQGEGWYPFGGLRAWRSVSGALRFTIEQDLSGWVTRTSVTSDYAPAESAETTYRYASDGNVIAVDSPDVNNVGHDSLGRITFDRGSFYSYDDAGNRLSGPGGAVEYPDPSSNRWSSAEGGTIAYQFDAAGNVTQRGDLALVTADDGTVIALDSPVQGESRFSRDHRNLRLATAGASGNERFVHSAAGDLELRLLEPIAEACGMGQFREVTPVEHYVYLGGRRVAMVAGRLESGCGGVGSVPLANVGASHFYFADKMDLARAVYRESDGRAVWRGELDAFAVPVGSGIDEDPDGDGFAFGQAFRLPGQQEIPGTQLSENWNRVYDRVAGRYLQPDPLPGVMLRGQSWSNYPYVENRALAATDPRGTNIKFDGWNRIYIDKWDDKCCPDGSESFEFSPDLNRPLPWVPWGLGYAGVVTSTPSTGDVGRGSFDYFYCTSCEQDRLALERARIYQANPPPHIDWIGNSGEGFANDILIAAGINPWWSDSRGLGCIGQPPRPKCQCKPSGGPP